MPQINNVSGTYPNEHEVSTFVKTASQLPDDAWRRIACLFHVSWEVGDMACAFYNSKSEMVKNSRNEFYQEYEKSISMSMWSLGKNDSFFACEAIRVAILAIMAKDLISESDFKIMWHPFAEFVLLHSINSQNHLVKS